MTKKYEFYEDKDAIQQYLVSEKQYYISPLFYASLWIIMIIIFLPIIIMNNSGEELLLVLFFIFLMLGIIFYLRIVPLMKAHKRRIISSCDKPALIITDKSIIIRDYTIYKKDIRGIKIKYDGNFFGRKFFTPYSDPCERVHIYVKGEKGSYTLDLGINFSQPDRERIKFLLQKFLD